jgi:hypothetical protein
MAAKKQLGRHPGTYPDYELIDGKCHPQNKI